MVVSHERQKVTIQFPDGLADLRDLADYRFASELDLDWGKSDHIAPKPLTTPDLVASAPARPYGAMIETNAPEGYWLTVPAEVPPPERMTFSTGGVWKQPRLRVPLIPLQCGCTWTAPCPPRPGR